MIKKDSLKPILRGTPPKFYPNEATPYLEACCQSCFQKNDSSPIPSPRQSILRRNSSPARKVPSPITSPRSPRDMFAKKPIVGSCMNLNEYKSLTNQSDESPSISKIRRNSSLRNSSHQSTE